MRKSILVTLSVFLIAAIGSWLFFLLRDQQASVISTTDRIGKRHYILHERNRTVSFDLIDPESSPPEIYESVMRGYRIIIETPKYAKGFAGDRLTCSNCHFAGGNTLGGKNGGISLVGVTAVYPRYSKRSGRKITLKERINNCFMRSMNGQPLPEKSAEMEDMIAYLTWISQEVMRIGTFPWLGLPKINIKHQPDAKQGALVYGRHCNFCHNSDGNGGAGIPPIWGNGSYNDGAGMDDIKLLAPFLWNNMPYQQPILTREEALDVAAYVSSQPRPHFMKADANNQ